MSKMLLSIKPVYVKRILEGKKKYEFRKFHCKEGVDTIIIYSTAPEKKVIGEVPLIDIIEGDVEYVWQQTRPDGGITKKAFKEYYKDKEIATAYKLGEVVIYEEPKELADFGLNYAPQSFAYIEG